MYLHGSTRMFGLLPVALFCLAWTAALLFVTPMAALVGVLGFFMGATALVGIASVRRGGIVRRADGSGLPAPAATIGLAALSAASGTLVLYALIFCAYARMQHEPFSSALPYVGAAVFAWLVDAVIAGRVGYRLSWPRALLLASLHGTVPFAILVLMPMAPAGLVLLGVCGIAVCWRGMRPERVVPKPRDRA